MLLTQIAGITDLSVLRDGEFRNLGFLSQNLDATLVFLDDPRFAPSLRRAQGISAVLTTPALGCKVPGTVGLALCAEPRIVFAQIHNLLAGNGFYWRDFETGIDPSAEIHPTAWIAPRNVRIGGSTVVGPHATVMERCIIGERAVIGAGAVLGGAGFQTVRTSRPMVEMRHAGGLIVRDGVHILPGAVVATGMFRENTELAADGRIGSQAFVSHAVRVGQRSFIGHGAVVNGNVAIGEDAWIGPGAVVAPNLAVGDGAFVTLGAVVIRNVTAGARVSGNFAISHGRLLRSLAAIESARPD